MASTALTASAANVPSAMSVSMFVARWTNNRAAFRRNGHPPANSTTNASASTDHPAVGVSRAKTEIRSAATASGHETMARSPQCSEC